MNVVGENIVGPLNRALPLFEKVSSPVDLPRIRLHFSTSQRKREGTFLFSNYVFIVLVGHGVVSILLTIEADREVSDLWQPVEFRTLTFVFADVI